MSKLNIIPISIKKESTSGHPYEVAELYYNSGDKVVQGDVIITLEASKVSIDIEAPSNGYIHYNCKKNQSIIEEDIVAAISKSPTISHTYFKSVSPKIKDKEKNTKGIIETSKPVLELLRSYNLDIKLFGANMQLTKKDVESYIIKNKIKKSADIEFSKNDLVIYGGGGHAKMCIDILNQTDSYNLNGIIDDRISVGSTILNTAVIGRQAHLDQFIKQGLSNIVLGIGAILNHKLRSNLFSVLKSKNLRVPTIIHPSAIIEPSVRMGEGNHIMQGAIIGSDVEIGENCILNSGCIVSHDTIIGNNVHITPGAIIAGGVTIQDNTVIGMGATIFLGVNIGKNVTIHNGVRIFSDVSDNETVRE